MRTGAQELLEDAARRGELLFSHLFEVLAAGSWIYRAPARVLLDAGHHDLVTSIKVQGLRQDLAAFVGQVDEWLRGDVLKPFGHARLAGLRLVASLALASDLLAAGEEGGPVGEEAGGAEEEAVGGSVRRAVALVQRRLHGASPRAVVQGEEEEGVPEVYRRQLAQGRSVAEYSTPGVGKVCVCVCVCVCARARARAGTRNTSTAILVVILIFILIRCVCLVVIGPLIATLEVILILI
jgi:hypothetical protein